MKTIFSKIVRLYEEFRKELKDQEPEKKENKQKPPRMKVKRDPAPKPKKSRYQEVEVSHSTGEPGMDEKDHFLVRIHQSEALRNSVQLLSSVGLLAFLAPLLQSETGMQVWLTVLIVVAFLLLVVAISVWTSNKSHSRWLALAPYLLVVIAVGYLAVKPFSPLPPRIYVARTGESYSFFDPQRYISHTQPISEDARLIAANHPAHGWMAAALRDINGDSDEKGGWHAASRWLPDSLKRRLKTDVVFLDETQRGSFNVIPVRIPEKSLRYGSDLTGAGYKAYDFEIGAAMLTNISVGLKPITRMKSGDTRLGVDFKILSRNGEENIGFDLTNRLETAQWEDIVLYSDFDSSSALYATYLSEFFLAPDMREAWAIYQPKLWQTVPNDRERVRLLLLAIRLNNVSASGILLQAQSLPDLRRLDAIWSGKSITPGMLAEDQFLFWAAQEFLDLSDPFCGIVTPVTSSTSSSSSTPEADGSTSITSFSRTDTKEGTRDKVADTEEKDSRLFSNRFRQRRQILEEAVLAVKNANTPVNLIKEHWGNKIARHYSTGTTHKFRANYPLSTIIPWYEMFRDAASPDRRNTAAAWVDAASWTELKGSLREDPQTEFLFSGQTSGSVLGRGGRLGPEADKGVFQNAFFLEYLRRVALAAEDRLIDEFTKSDPDFLQASSELLDAALSQGELLEDFATHAEQIRAKGFDAEMGADFEFLRLATSEYHELRSSSGKAQVPPLVNELLAFVSSSSVRNWLSQLDLAGKQELDGLSGALGNLEKDNPRLLHQIIVLANAAQRIQPDRLMVDLWTKRLEAFMKILESPDLRGAIAKDSPDPAEISKCLISAIRTSSLEKDEKDMIIRLLRLEETLRCYLAWQELAIHRNQLGSRMPGLREAAESTRSLISQLQSTFLQDFAALAADRPRSPLWAFLVHQMDLNVDSPEVHKTLEEALAGVGGSTRKFSASEQRLKSLVDRLTMISIDAGERSIVVNRTTGRIEFDPPFPALEEWIRTVSMAQGSESEGGGFPFTADALILDLLLRTMNDQTIVGYRETTLGMPGKIFEKVAGQTVEQYVDDSMGDLTVPEPDIRKAENAGLTGIPISKIVIERDGSTLPSFILKELEIAGVRPGVDYDSESMRRALSELSATDFFEDISLDLPADPKGNGIQIVLDFKEKVTGWIGTKFGYIDGPDFYLELGQPNFNAFAYPFFVGGGNSFVTKLRLKPDNESLEVELGSRNFFGNPLVLTLPSRVAPIEPPPVAPAPPAPQPSALQAADPSAAAPPVAPRFTSPFHGLSPDQLKDIAERVAKDEKWVAPRAKTNPKKK